MPLILPSINILIFNFVAVSISLSVLISFNKSLNTDPRGKMIIDDFQSGKLHVLHSISYQGMYSRKSEFLRDPKPFSKWIQRFGKRGKDMVSVVACNSHFYEAPMLDRWKRKENALFVYDAGFGFIMKGYPAFIAHTDVMSQTLSAIPDTLKDHQKHSGIAKRAGDIDDALSFDDWYSGVGSDETLLDNWSIVGIFLGQEILHRNPELIIADAKSTGLDIYQVTPKRSLQKVN